MQSPLRLPEYRAYAQVRFFMSMGWHMQAIVVQWYVYALTKDLFILGLIGLAEALPAITAALPMGSLVDRMEKRRAITIAGLIILMSAIGTTTLTHSATLALLGKDTILIGLFACIIVNGSARSMYSPAMFTTLGKVVPIDMIPQASALGSTLWQTAMIAGPIIASLLYGIAGVTVSGLVYVGLMLVSLSGIVMLPRMDAIRHEQRKPIREELTAGLRFIFSKNIILGALSLDLFAVLFGGVTALLPYFSDEILGTGEWGLGFLRSSMSVGSVAMMAYLSIRPPKGRVGRVLLWAVAGYGVSIIAFGFSTNFLLSVTLLGLAGMFDSISVVVRHTVLQLQTPEAMKGRVAAANTMFITSSNEIGAFESGVAAKLLGAVNSVLFGGVMTLVVVAVIAWRNKELRRMEL